MDWKDHVWNEVLVQGEWMHIDPCEAAVNDKRMYVGWGKEHTYIVALSREALEDVTEAYTDSLDAARVRTPPLMPGCVEPRSVRTEYSRANCLVLYSPIAHPRGTTHSSYTRL